MHASVCLKCSDQKALHNKQTIRKSGPQRFNRDALFAEPTRLRLDNTVKNVWQYLFIGVGNNLRNKCIQKMLILKEDTMGINGFQKIQ